MMRLYGETRSERAEKGQGGNKFVETVYTVEHDNKEREEIGRTRVEKEDNSFSMTHKTAQGIETTTKIPIKGKNQQTQKGECTHLVTHAIYENKQLQGYRCVSCKEIQAVNPQYQKNRKA